MIDLILGIWAVLLLLVCVPFDGRRDGGQHALNMRPHSKLPWPLQDRWHALKYLSIAPLWAFCVAVVVRGLGLRAGVPVVVVLAVVCLYGWTAGNRLEIRRLGGVPHKTTWDRLVGLFLTRRR